MLADTDCFEQRLAWENQLRMGHRYCYIPHCRENLDRITYNEIVTMEMVLWTGNRTSSLCEPRESHKTQRREVAIIQASDIWIWIFFSSNLKKGRLKQF